MTAAGVPFVVMTGRGVAVDAVDVDVDASATAKVSASWLGVRRVLRLDEPYFKVKYNNGE